MKFLQLKDALDKALPPAPEPEKPQPKPELPAIAFYSPGERKQTVVGGELLRTPVDRTARLVVSKAPWWAKPPENPLPPIQDPTPPPEPAAKPRKKKPMSHSPTVERTAHPAQADGVTVHAKKPDDVLNAELASELVKRTKQSVSDAESLVERSKDARAALDVMADTWQRSWVEFMEESDARLRKLRESRMAFDSETKILMTSLREVRQFFLDKDHATELARLKEFVELCERLQKLKQSGFLDTVADTLLKLA